MSSGARSNWWQPNHFVPLFPADLQTITPVVIEEEQSITEQKQLDEEEEEHGATEGEQMDGELEEE